MHKFNQTKLLKILFVTTLILLCILIIWALVFYIVSLKLQWWVKAMIIACLAASVLIAVLLRKLVLKRREMKFVDAIIGNNEMTGSMASVNEAARQLRSRFRQAVSTLKRSHLKHRGNPLYVLPWYLVVGRSGAGKSTAIKSARLTSPFGDFNRVAGIEGTRNCDWWFFDESVIIDIAGRYSVHCNENLDKEEWRAFLEQLVRYRKKEPINGVIVTVEADQLLEGNLEKTEEEGKIIRNRIEEITSVMGAKFPVYLMVTKVDLIYGVERYLRLLSESSASQAMGLMNHDKEIDTHVFVNKAIDTVTQRLKDIRLIMANDEKVRGRYYIEPEVLIFPNEFSRIRDGLIAFCKGAFKENPFQELPFLRGIYFSSGSQQHRSGNCLSKSMGKLATRLSRMNGEKEVENSEEGFFLYDFFAKILPSDRSLYSMTTAAKQWHRLTHNLWLTGFVTLVLVLCILTTYAWNENNAILNSVSSQYKKDILFTNDPIANISLMADFSREIKAVETQNKNWKLPRMGLDASLELEQILKRKYCKRFKDQFDIGITRSIENKIINDGWVHNEYAAAIRFIPFAVRQINMVQGKFNGADAAQLAELPAPDFALMIHGNKQKSLEPKVTERYKYAYINYLVWQKDTHALNRTLVKMRSLLKNYFHENQEDLRWLIKWADQSIPDNVITMNKFWKSNVSDAELPTIGSAYTFQGRQLISDFVTQELEKAVEHSLWLVKPKEGFLLLYQDNFYRTWTVFSQNFSKARALFPKTDQWASVIGRLTSDDSPYLELLQTMAKQFDKVGDEKWPQLNADLQTDQNTRRWLNQVKQFGMIKTAMAGDVVAGNKAVAKELGQKMSYRAKMVGKIVASGMKESTLAKGKHAYKRYLEALQGFDGIAASRSHAYSVAKAGFEDETQADSALFSADRAIDGIRSVLAPADYQAATDKSLDPFWGLLVEPVNELWRYCVQEAGNHLQYLWDREVLVRTDGVSDRYQMVSLLFGDKGYADSFLEKHAGPFLERSYKKGYHSKVMRGCSVPFKESYFRFIRSGQRWISGAGKTSSSHAVTVAAYPTDVNIEARVNPHMTRLVLEGTNGNTILENRQYPIEKKFVWRLGKSKDVKLQIMIGDITLTRTYTGEYAFGKFIREFKMGKRTFTAHDFPSYRNEFQRLGIYKLDVRYRFHTGQISPIIRKMKTTPKQVPATIISG